MNNLITFIIFLCLCVNAAAADTPAENKPSRDLNRIIDSGKVTIAVVDMDIPPFIMKSRDGQLEGLDIDIARDIAGKMKVDLEIIRVDYFDDVIDLVAAGKADIGVSNLSMTCDRARYVRFTDPYRVLGITLLLNRVKLTSMRLPDGEIKPEQLKNTDEAVGVLERSAYDTAAREYLPSAVFRTYTDYSAMLGDAEKGNLFMSVGNSGTVDYYLKKEPRQLVKLQPYNIEGFKDHIAMAVGLENDHLLSWLNVYLTVRNDKNRQVKNKPVQIKKHQAESY
jgi:ABC-type amino acid transport substrate-binding protein